MTDHELMQLSEIVGLALKQRGATITTAESCTGGWVAKVITDIAGSSAWFERGFVTYSKGNVIMCHHFIWSQIILHMQIRNKTYIA